MTRDLPIVDPTELEYGNAGEAVDAAGSTGRIAGLVLAAGTSTRFGASNKLLATVDGTPIVHHATQTLLDASLDPVIVVTGYESTRVSKAVADLPVQTVENPEYESGHGTSIATGVESLPEDISAVVIALGDMPFVKADSVRQLVTTFQAGDWTALAAANEGARGNPVFFDRTHFDELRSLSGDEGGRSVLLNAPDAALVETGDPGVRRDIDTTTDLPD